MAVTKEGREQERKEGMEEGRGKLWKDFLHHVSSLLANYLQRTEKKQKKNPMNCQMVSSAILHIRKKLLAKRRED